MQTTSSTDATTAEAVQMARTGQNWELDPVDEAELYAPAANGKTTAHPESYLDDMLTMLEKELAATTPATSSSRQGSGEAHGMRWLTGGTTDAAAEGRSDCFERLCRSSGGGCMYNTSQLESTATAPSTAISSDELPWVSDSTATATAWGKGGCTGGNTAIPDGLGGVKQDSCKGVGEEVDDGCLVLNLELGDEVDLNKVPEYELKLAKVRGVELQQARGLVMIIKYCSIYCSVCRGLELFL
jgi:hypothetical protein